MPASFNQIASDTASVSFSYGSFTFNIVYYPSRITDKMLRALSALQASNATEVLDGFDSFNQALASIVKSWDLFKDDEQTIMWPLDADSLSELPIPFKKAVFFAIVEEMNPNSQVA